MTGTRPNECMHVDGVYCRVDMSRNTVRALFHGSVFLSFITTLIYEVLYISEEPGEGISSLFTYRGYGGKFKYLTFICEMILPIYFAVCLLSDIQSLKRAEPTNSKLHRFRDTFFSSIALPLGTFVVLTFWLIYAVDRELIFPKRLDAFVPGWMNHAMHTLPLPSLALDMFLTHHHFPRRLTGISITVGFAFAYQIWIFWVAFHTGVWVYPVLRVLTWPARIAFIFTCNIFFSMIYLACEKLNGLAWERTKVIKRD